MILGAEDKLYALEYQLFCEVRDTLAKEIARIQKRRRQWPASMCLRLFP